MDLINAKVKHKLFGNGVVTAQEDSYVIVKFKNSEREFLYPSAFEAYLEVVDDKIAEKIDGAIEEEKKAELIEKQRLEEERREQKEREELERRKEELAKRSIRSNIAFRYNYCDGGISEKQIGYEGVCSDDNLKNNVNIEKNAVCAQEDGLCFKFANDEITREELDEAYEEGKEICTESRVLKDWITYAGHTTRADGTIRPISLRDARKDKLCILTTRLPKASEAERIIFGVFVIDDYFEGSGKLMGYTAARDKYRITLSKEEAEKMLFWNYHANTGRPDKAIWGSGLYRYTEDDVSIQILQDIIEVKTDPEEKAFAQEVLDHYCKLNLIRVADVPEKQGALLIK